MIQNVQSNRTAFTRVELLAVIATLGLLLLAGIPLRALQGNGESSTAVVDLNNVRQIMAAMNMYTVDHADRLPHPTWGGIPAGPDGWAYITENKGRLPGLPDRIPSLGGMADKSAQMPWAGKGQIAPYLQSLEALECPKDVQERADAQYYNRYVQRNCKITSYNWNGAILQGWPQGGLQSHKISGFQGTDILQWEANEIVSFNFNDAAANPVNGSEAVSQRHGHGTANVGAPNEGGGAGTVGYFGGQAKLMRHREFANLREAGGPNALLCGPGYR